jgi:deoxyribose-phosphate aldolase
VHLAREEFSDTEYRNSAVVCFPMQKNPIIDDMIADIRANHIGAKKGMTLARARFYEIDRVLHNGGTDIDMIIDLEAAKRHDYSAIKKDVAGVMKHIDGKDDVLVKVIECAPYFNDDELIEISKAVVNRGADYLKTTTGFGARNAPIRDVNVFATVLDEMGSPAGIKAAGGITYFDQAAAFFGVSQAYGARPFIIGASEYVSVRPEDSSPRCVSGY